MDPNETLKELLEYLKGWQYNQMQKRNAERPQYAPYTLHAKAHYYDEIMKHFEALNEWLSKGGFLPANWNHGDRTIDYPDSGSHHIDSGQQAYDQRQLERDLPGDNVDG